MKHLFKILSFITILIFHTQCGTETTNDNLLGGSEVGNPPDTITRHVIGAVEANTLSVSSLKYATVDSGCVVDTIVSTTTDEEETTATIDENCTFDLNLVVDKAYSLAFYLNSDLLATMIFKMSETTQSFFFLLSDGEDAVDLGTIIFNFTELTATPEFEPAEQNDAHGDGINDYQDTDDDGDGIPDSEEEDCDEDGILDDFDLDTSTCPDESESETPDTDGDGFDDDTDTVLK